MTRKQSEQAVSELYRTWGLEPAQRPDGTAADRRELVELCGGALSSEPSGDDYIDVEEAEVPGMPLNPKGAHAGRELFGIHREAS
jgi:hypothetical protein